MFGAKPQTPPTLTLQPSPTFGAFGATQPAAQTQAQMVGGLGGSFGGVNTAQSTPGMFGAATTGASNPQFSFNTFGAASASTPSLFGGAAAATQSTPGFSFPSMFGGGNLTASSSSLAAPASFPSMFGGASTSGMFGSSTAGGTTPAFGTTWGAGGGLMNAAGATPTPFGGGIGGGIGATPTGAIPGFPPFPSDTGHLASSQVANDLQALDAAFNPKATNNSYRFRHLFTNVVTSDQSVSLASKPQNVDAVQWQEAVDEVESLESLTASNRPAHERLWPVGLGYGETSGFQELITRAQSQEAEIAKHKEFLERVQGTIASITRKHEVDIQKAVQNCRLKYEEQTHKLIHIMRFVDFLERRTFRHPFTSQEDALAKKFSKLQKSQASELAQLPKRIEALAALAREMKAHQKANGQARLTSGSDRFVSGFTPDSCEKICNTLSKYLEAVNKVQTSLQRDLVHLDIVEKHSKDFNTRY